MKTFFSAGILLLLTLVLRAGEPAAPQLSPQPTTPESEFAKGSYEFQNVTGAFRFFEWNEGTNNRPSVDYAIDSVRLGIMLNNPYDLGLLSGNFEFLGELFGGGIVQGPGDVLTGATLVFRYNFIQPNSRIVPYFQIGAGGVYTNITEKDSLGLISLPVEFNLQSLVGVRYLLNDRWSLVVEGGYRHISNAGIRLPNIGIDSIGGNVGFGFSF